MKNIESRSNPQGSVTVFLSLVFMLILALILVTLESARVTAVQSSMAMAMTQSMDSVLAEYYRPLLEEYQLFGRYQTEATDTMRKKALEDEMKQLLEYTSNPQAGLNLTKKQLYCVLQSSLQEVNVNQLDYLGDTSNDMLYQQAGEAVKFYGMQRLVDKVLSGVEILNNTATAAKAFSMQSEAEEKLAGLDKYTLDLIELIEGISVKRGRIQQEGELLESEDSFAKMFVSMPVSMESVNINHAVVFESLRGNYMEKESIYSECIEKLEELVRIQEELEAADLKQCQAENVLYQIEIEKEDLLVKEYELREQIAVRRDQIEELSVHARRNREEIEALRRTIESLEEELDGVNKTYSDLQQQYSVQWEVKERFRQEYNELLRQTNELSIDAQVEMENADCVIQCCRDVLERSIQKVEKAIQKQEEARNIVTELEEKLNVLKIGMAEDIVASLEEELNHMKQSVGMSAGSPSETICCNYNEIKQTLIFDYNLISNQITDILPYFGGDIEDIQSLLTRVIHNQEILCQYSIEHLEFDYSTLNLNQEHSNVILDGMKELIASGITELVIEDTSKISAKEINTAGLPSTLAGVMHTKFADSGRTSELSDLNQSVFHDLLDQFSELFGDNGDFLEFVKGIADAALFQVYIQEFFKDYTKEDVPQTDTVLYPSVLDYEKEYMCFHEKGDNQNLSEMIATLFFIRLVVQMIAIITDRECNQKARITAASLVAFTGMTFLVTITKLLILTAWAAVEAFIDVAAILKGKEVAVFPLHTQQIHYEELLSVNKSKIQTIAGKYEANGGVTMEYDDYLFLFLLLQSKQSKCYSVMDLIQENLNYRYEGGFELAKCICGIHAQIMYQVQPLFASGGSYQNGISCTRTAAVSY